jgi:hypothetical protein
MVRVTACTALGGELGPVRTLVGNPRTSAATPETLAIYKECVDHEIMLGGRKR